MVLAVVRGDKRLGRDALARLDVEEARPATSGEPSGALAVNESCESYASRAELLARIAQLEDQVSYYRAQSDRLLAVVESLAGRGPEHSDRPPSASPACGAPGGCTDGKLKNVRRGA